MITSTTIGVTVKSIIKISRRASNQLDLTSDSEYYFLVEVITMIILIAILDVQLFAKKE
jgi:hypothetical protein